VGIVRPRDADVNNYTPLAATAGPEFGAHGVKADEETIELVPPMPGGQAFKLPGRCCKKVSFGRAKRHDYAVQQQIARKRVCRCEGVTSFLNVQCQRNSLRAVREMMLVHVQSQFIEHVHLVIAMACRRRLPSGVNARWLADYVQQLRDRRSLIEAQSIDHYKRRLPANFNGHNNLLRRSGKGSRRRLPSRP
jgi:hypothetical protein